MIEWLFLLLIVGNCLGSIPPQELSRIADPVPDVEFQSASESEGVQPICANRLIEPRPWHRNQMTENWLTLCQLWVGHQSQRELSVCSRREVIIPIHNEEARIGGEQRLSTPATLPSESLLVLMSIPRSLHQKKKTPHIA
ncbi:hypothetical protein PSTT_08159 [Puccinia striiformis]|uniref:Secreted protein n=1 Tax=Puccinia striiformis TaxID=27350 RepID=A0A2S4VDH1_9BASI|nr:hypothetical protein PSTT_08159 [Puccinia striiformis]